MKRKSQNIIHRLRYRELVDSKPRTSYHYIHRCLYQNICPNMSVINIDKPPCFLRKFTPDGKYLIAFSNDQSSLHIYAYQGPAGANDLLQKITIEGDLVGERGRMDESVFVRANIFSHFFKLKNVVNLTSNYERLNRECSLFTNDSRYVIVASSATINDQVFPSYYDVLRNNESMGVNIRFFLEDFYIHLIDILKGEKCDQLVFKTDYIILSHNQGIYLHNDILAVLSIQHQTIHIYHIVNSRTTGKKFLLINSIGRFCFEDDCFIVASPLEDSFLVSSSSSSSSPPFPSSSSSSPNPTSSSNLIPQANSPDPAFHEVFISALKHRFLAFIYRRVLKESKTTGNPHPLVNYHRKFDHYLSLRMSKMQLLDKDHLLIKYEVNESITSRLLDHNSYPSYFVAYQISTATILQIYENNSDELLRIFETYCDYFRNTHTYICSAGNNVYARTIAQRFKKLLIRDGGPTEATRRILSLLPISAQSYTPCPYLDLSLFSYDDRWVTPMERPKSCGEYPIRFYCRDNGSLRFKIHADHQRNDSPSALRLVAFAFHPYDPFVISIQRTNSDFAVNLHIRHVLQRL